MVRSCQSYSRWGGRPVPQSGTNRICFGGNWPFSRLYPWNEKQGGVQPLRSGPAQGSRLLHRQRVGWVERSDTHLFFSMKAKGFAKASTDPTSYINADPGSPRRGIQDDVLSPIRPTRCAREGAGSNRSAKYCVSLATSPSAILIDLWEAPGYLISEVGHLRPGRASSESAHVCWAAESGNRSRVFVTIAGRRNPPSPDAIGRASPHKSTIAVRRYLESRVAGHGFRLRSSNYRGQTPPNGPVPAIPR